MPINELLNEIASSAFGPPRNDATTLIICDVAYGARAIPVITYILTVFISAIIKFQVTFNESCKRFIVFATATKMIIRNKSGNHRDIPLKVGEHQLISDVLFKASLAVNFDFS